MGLYDQALASNAQGQSQALQLRQQALGQPTAVERFMSGLMAGRDRLMQQQQMEQQRLASDANRKAKADELKAKVFKTTWDVVKGAGNTVDPSKLGPMIANFVPEGQEFIPEALQAVSTQGGVGGQYDISERRQATDEGYKSQLGQESGTRQRVMDAKLGPQIDEIEARTRLLEHNAQRPFSSQQGGGDRESWSPVPGYPGEPLRLINRYTGEIKESTVNRPLKPIPPVAAKAIQANAMSLEELDRAEQALKLNKGAVGFVKGNMPDALIQRLDEKGTATRALISKISAIKIHDLTGSAQTVGEVARLRPFLPNISDTPEVIQEKLGILRQEIKSYEETARSIYGAEQGYQNAGALDPKEPNKLKELLTPKPKQSQMAIPTFSSPGDPGFADLPSGSKFYDSTGKLRIKK